MDNMQTQELISALVDGQLQGDAFVRGVDLAVRDPLARDAWQTYHLIGDVMRSGAFAVGTEPSAFMSRLQARLAEESRVQPRPAEIPAPAQGNASPKRVAANDDSFRWKLVAGFASLAAVAAVGWTVAGGILARSGEQLAGMPAGTVIASGERGPMIRDPRIDEFLAAHRQLGGASALQMPAGFLRNATFEGGSR